jgi:hypothetical protein
MRITTFRARLPESGTPPAATTISRLSGVRAVSTATSLDQPLRGVTVRRTPGEPKTSSARASLGVVLTTFPDLAIDLDPESVNVVVVVLGTALPSAPLPWNVSGTSVTVPRRVHAASRR